MHDREALLTSHSGPSHAAAVTQAQIAAGALVCGVLHRKIVHRGQVGVALVVGQHVALAHLWLDLRLHNPHHPHPQICSNADGIVSTYRAEVSSSSLTVPLSKHYLTAAHADVSSSSSWRVFLVPECPVPVHLVD